MDDKDVIIARLQREIEELRELVLQLRDKIAKLAVASAADRMKVDGNLAEIGVPHESFDAVNATYTDTPYPKLIPANL